MLLWLQGPTHRLEINPVGVDASQGSTVLHMSDLNNEEGSTDIIVQPEDSYTKKVNSLAVEVEHLKTEVHIWWLSKRDVSWIYIYNHHVLHFMMAVCSVLSLPRSRLIFIDPFALSRVRSFSFKNLDYRYEIKRRSLAHVERTCWRVNWRMLNWELRLLDWVHLGPGQPRLVHSTFTSLYNLM